MITLEFANAYFAERLHTTTWDAATNPNKTKALVMAERMVRACFDFESGAITQDDNDNDVYTPFVAYAICEQALYVLGLDPTAYPEVLTLGLASAGAAGASATFDATKIAPYICPTTIRLVGDWGTFDDAADTAGRIASISLGHGG